jgi:chromosome partitioning protein
MTFWLTTSRSAMLSCRRSSSGLFIAPATTDLSSTDVDLVDHENRAGLLRAALRDTPGQAFDVILIDCPPSLSLLTVNALVAADAALVPLQTEFFALEGLSQLLLTVRQVRESANPDLRVDGVVLTMFDQRNNLCRQVEEDARETLGDLVYRTRIPRNVRVSEAPSYALAGDRLRSRVQGKRGVPGAGAGIP